MAQYGGGGPRYPRPGPRFPPRQNPNPPRPNFNDPRPSLQPRPIKPTPDMPTTSNSPLIRNQNTASSTDSSTESPNKTLKPTTSESSAAAAEQTFESSDTKIMTKSDTTPSDDEQRTISSGGIKRPRTDNNSQVQSTEKKPTQGGRCRLFIGNIPSDLTQEEFQLLFGKYGELVEYFVNPSRGFGFIKLSSRHIAEQAKYDLDGYILRGKPLRIRFASQGATIKVKNLSPNVSNELLKDSFEQYFGTVERAVVIVDDRGKSTGEGIIEFEKKPSAQKCLNECTERCFFVTSKLRPVIVEPWDIRDDEDGLPEKSLVRNPAYIEERDGKPHFAELNTIEHTIGLKWKELELQEKQLLEEVKRRMQFATEQVQKEIDQMNLEHQAYMLREELQRRQEDLRRIDELRSQETNRRSMPPPMHRDDGFNTYFHPNYSYNDYPQGPTFGNPPPPPPPNPLMQQNSPDAVYTTNQVVRGYGIGNNNNNNNNQVRTGAAEDYFHPQHDIDRKRPRY